MEKILRQPERQTGKSLPFHELTRLDRFQGLAAWLGRRLLAQGLSGEGMLLLPSSDSDEWELLALRGEEEWQLANDHPLPELLGGLDHDAQLSWRELEGLPRSFAPGGSCRVLPLSGRQMRFLGALLVDLDSADRSTADLDRYLSEQRDLASLACERILLLRRQQALIRGAKELEEQKSQFVSTISHELKTPLTSILGFIDLAMTQPAVEEDRTLSQFLEGIRFSALNLQQLITEVLTMGGMVSAGREVNVGQHGFPDLYREFREKYLADMPESSRVRELSDPAACSLKVDRRQFHRILQHLVGNALKFSGPDDPVELDWHLVPGQRRSDHNDFLRLDVRDYGPGIPEPEQEKIFEKFYQVDGSSTRAAGGLGVGLTLAREFTEAMGGRIWVKNAEDRGCVFSLMLPVPRKS